MEYCNGKDLRELIRANPFGLPEQLYLSVQSDLIAALKQLQEKEIFHGDIKPENILISVSSDRHMSFKLADFGAARILPPGERFETVNGTYEYLHPEMFEKHYAHALHIIPRAQTFEASHEIWSVGVTLYEAAVGQLPFDPTPRRANHTIMHRMISEKPPNHLSATQENGQIKWMKELPATCSLTMAMKIKITSFLVGLLDVCIYLPSKCAILHSIFYYELFTDVESLVV